MVEKQVSVRIATIGGKAVKADFTEIGLVGKRALNDIERSSGGSRLALQNVGFQVQDFAVQVAGGTSAARALAQQLPQLLSGFGLLGVALGTAAAVFLPFVSGMLTGADNVKALDDSLSDLEKSTKDYETAAQNAALPIEALTLKFGDQAVAVKGLYEAQLALAQLDLASKQQQVNEAIAESFSGLTDQLAAIDRIRTAMDNPMANSDQLANFRDALDAVMSEMGMTEEQARRVQSAIEAINTAAGPQELVSGYVALRQSIVDAAGGYSHLTGPQQEVIDKIIKAEMVAVSFNNTDMSSGINGAKDSADGLLSKMLEARAVAASFTPGREVRMLDDERGSQRQTNIGATNHFFDGNQPWIKKNTGGGGGVSDAQKEQNKLMEEAKRVIASTRTETEKYKDELAKLDEMLAQHLLTQDQYNRAVADLKEKFGGVGEAAKKMGDDIGKALEDIIIGGEDANQVISKLLASFASEMFQSGWSKLMGSFTGGGGGMGSIFDLFGGSFLGGFAKGGAFAGGNVIPFASGGIVSSPTHFPMRSGLGLMGEAGPEAIMPLRRGSDGRLGVAAARDGSGGAVTVQVSVDARGAVEGVAQQVSDAVQKHIPSIVKQAVAGVSSAKRRGYPV